MEVCTPSFSKLSTPSSSTTTSPLEKGKINLVGSTPEESDGRINRHKIVLWPCWLFLQRRYIPLATPHCGTIRLSLWLLWQKCQNSSLCLVVKRFPSNGSLSNRWASINCAGWCSSATLLALNISYLSFSWQTISVLFAIFNSPASSSAALQIDWTILSLDFLSQVQTWRLSVTSLRVLSIYKKELR